MGIIEQLSLLFINMDFVTACLLVVGVICFIGEIYQPGTKALGILGTICSIGGIISRVLIASEGESVFLIIFALVAIICIITLISFVFMVRFSRSAWIDHAPDVKKEIEEDERYKKLNGATGVTTSALRPKGVASIFDGEYEVYAEGFYIGNNEQIKVIKIESGKIFVKKI